MRDLLRRHGLRADRGFGQNFLVDAHALEAIVVAADPQPSDTVIEVGPGLGTLTVPLAQRAGRIVALEADRRLAPVLDETLRGLDNVALHFVDALDYDLGTLPTGSLLVANLPYNVGTAVLLRALAAGRFAALVVLVQREVADRLLARPGTGAYGSLSLYAQHHARVRRVRDVAPGSFDPPPKVTSSVVRLDVRSDAEPEPELFAFVRLGFVHRRKTLARGLALAGYDRGRVLAALDGAGLDPKVRAERLDLEDFRALHRALQSEHPTS